jgi:signal peptidase II
LIRNVIPWFTAAVIVVADRVTKILIVQGLDVGDWQPVFPGFSLTHVHNRGIAFSLFAEGGWQSRIVLHGVILIAVVLIAWMLFRHGQQRLIAGLAFGLILGGAVGNLIDRVLYGWVIDFVHLWIRIGDRTWSFPDFNVGDSAITVGAGLLILSELFGQRSKGGNASDPG